MGLDISLEVAADSRLESVQYALEDEWYENNPQGADQTYEERRLLLKAYYDEHIPAEIKEAVKNARPFAPKSAVDPDHINTPTYLRSSYNEAGFNAVVPRRLNDESADYYGVFDGVRWKDENGNPSKYSEPGGYLNRDDLPALSIALERAQNIVERLAASDPYDVTFVASNPFSSAALPPSPAAALSIFRAEPQHKNSTSQWKLL